MAAAALPAGSAEDSLLTGSFILIYSAFNFYIEQMDHLIPGYTVRKYFISFLFFMHFFRVGEWKKFSTLVLVEKEKT